MEPPVPAELPEPERPPHLPAETLTWDGDAEDARWERKIRLFAIPVALLVTWALHSTGMGHRLLVLFFSMWIHELGHAVTAWLCGFLAVPGPWVTPVAMYRTPLFALLLAAGFGVLAWRGWKQRRRPLLVAGLALLGLQGVGTLLLGRAKAQSFVIFGGDAGCLVLGALLMLTLYAPKESSLRKGWTRASSSSGRRPSRTPSGPGGAPGPTSMRFPPATSSAWAPVIPPPSPSPSGGASTP